MPGRQRPGRVECREPMEGRADGARERALFEGQVEELAEEVDDVAHLAVVEDAAHLGAHLRLEDLAVHAFDDPEAGAEEAREDAERGG